MGCSPLGFGGTSAIFVSGQWAQVLSVGDGTHDVGSVATSVVMSITAVAPFNGTQDEDLAVAYISAFILVFFVRTRLDLIAP